MSPLLLGALVVGGVGALVLVSGAEGRDPAPSPVQLQQALQAFKGITGAQQTGAAQLFKVGPMVFEQLAPSPTAPDAAYVFELVTFAARSAGFEGKAERGQMVAEAQLALDSGDVVTIWARLWRLTRQGLYGRGSSLGMPQTKRDSEINAIVTNLIAYELYWRANGSESYAENANDRIRNLLHRYQYIVSRVLAPKVRTKYGARLASKVLKGCKLQLWRGPSWGKFLSSGKNVAGLPSIAALGPGLVLPGNITAIDCDADAVLLKLAAQVAYIIGQLAVLSINAKAYVGYDFGDLMAGVTMVGEAFSAS